jgi:hypothetical protein
MMVKKAGKTILGAHLTSDERKAIDIEMRKMVADANRKNENEIDAVFLWWLHEKLGFGEKRLRQFYDDFTPAIRELNARYELESADRPWLCTYKLKEIGVDLEAWSKEKEAGNKDV